MRSLMQKLHPTRPGPDGAAAAGSGAEGECPCAGCGGREGCPQCCESEGCWN
eukprot:gene23218-41662_t